MRALPLILLLACGSPPADDGDDVVPPTRFAFPVAPREAIRDVVGVDHDPATAEGLLGRAMCRNYRGEGFPLCYDGHDGSDFLLVGGFEAMDAGSAEVRAAADGVVVEVADGNYDRCHASIASGDVDCDGHPMIANAVVLEHADGLRSLYWHLLSGSPAVAVGDEVPRGALLGRIGSSGRSSLPHLHFEVNDADGNVLDPYAGPDAQPTSLWCEQEHGDGLPGPCG